MSEQPNDTPEADNVLDALDTLWTDDKSIAALAYLLKLASEGRFHVRLVELRERGYEIPDA